MSTAATLAPLQEVTTTRDAELDHYFYPECYPHPESEVRGFCGTGPAEDSEVDIRPGCTADCIVCADLAPNPPCGH